MTPPSDPDRWPAVKRLFEDALDRPEPERAAFLDAACRAPDGAPDPALREAVELLLRSDAEAERLAATTGGFLAGAPVALRGLLDDLGIEPPPLAAGARVGPYRVVRLLGRGGMGEVYLAERADGLYERAVALKRVRADLGPRVAARFERERRILAGLVHPGIARLYGAGVDAEGRPWLAMEPVDGAPITDYAEAHGLDRDARLALMLQVCRAVAHAHQRLVVHRDLKPSNVLVSDGDAGPRVQLLDFGIAQILGDGEDDQRLLTRAFAAPEQRRGEPATTATDVFGLGRLLAALVGPADGDLGAVLATAQAEDPADRYGSALALADDLERVRASRPVVARPQTIGRRMALAARRHRRRVAAGALGLALAVGGVAVHTARLADERDRAHAEAARAEAITDQLVGLFETSNPQTRPGADTLGVGAFLAEGAAEALAALAAQPRAQARLRHVLGRLHLARGDAEAARGYLEPALASVGPGADPVVRAAIRHDLGRMETLAAAPDRARDHLEAAVAAFRDALGDADARTIRAVLDLADVTDDTPRRRALRERSVAHAAALDPPDPAVHAAALHELAEEPEGGPARTAEVLERARAVAAGLSPLHPDRLDVDNAYAVALDRLGRHDEAVAIHRVGIEARRRALGDSSAAVATAYNNLGVAQVLADDLDGGEASLRESLVRWTALYGPDHPQTANTARSVAIVLMRRGRRAEALAMLEQAVRGFQRTYGVGSHEAAGPEGQLGAYYVEAGQVERGTALLDRSLRVIRQSVRDGRYGERWLADALIRTGAAALTAGADARAERSFAEALALRRTIFPEGHARVAEAELGVAIARHARGLPYDDVTEALRIYEAFPLPWQLLLSRARALAGG